jgi:phosphoglycerate dehydrogenase-like enzyme
MDTINLLVIGEPGARHLQQLDTLQANTVVSDRLDRLQEAAASADVILNAGLEGNLLENVFPLAKRLKWLHSMSAGVEKVLTPQIVASPVPLTNARGVFRTVLAEFAMAACFFFAKDLRRLVRSQDAGVWDQFDVEEIRGRVLGVVGYGEIGRACAELAHALGMKVVAARRRPGLAEGDPLLDKVYPPEGLKEMLAICDYVSLSTPNTASTRGLIGEAELRAMKSSAVLINVGRGTVVEEAALIRALQENWIRGAALDVFEHEPLAAGHPFYGMKNVLLSPHSADHTSDWKERSIACFVRNFERFAKGEPLENIVDKHAGY